MAVQMVDMRLLCRENYVSTPVLAAAFMRDRCALWTQQDWGHVAARHSRAEFCSFDEFVR